ncbi:9081_t:CDS:1, partial [Dentiscutata erythropus]
VKGRTKGKEYKIINNMELQEIVILSPVTMENEAIEEITDNQQQNNNVQGQLTSTTNASIFTINSSPQFAPDFGVNDVDKRIDGG